MREEATVRARVVAHYLEHGMRDAFAAERAKAAADKDRPDTSQVSDFFTYRQGGGKA